MIHSRFQYVRMIVTILVMMMVELQASAGITSITLKSTVRIKHDAPITLGQIGTIDGDQSDALDGMVIEQLLKDTGDGWLELSETDLRVLIESNDALLSGSIVIRGGSRVAVRRIEQTIAPATHTKNSTEDATAKGPVVRDHLDRWVRDRYKVGDDLVRMSFRNHDETFLRQSTSGMLVEIREISRRGRTAVRVILLKELIVTSEQALIFDVEIFREVLVATQRVNRGKVLDESMVMSERRWVGPDDQAATTDAALGMSISKTVNAGQLIEEQHIELPLVIRRGDIVSAKSIAGSVVVTVRGRATSNARLGEIIEIESLNGENRFKAKATGKGRAVLKKDGDLS